MNRIAEKKSIFGLLHSRGGMTLVEIIVAVLILGIATLVLMGAFGASMNLTRRGVDTQSAGNQAFAGIERGEAEAAPGAPDAVQFQPEGGTPIPVEGQYLMEEVEINGAKVTFYSFEAGENEPNP